MKFMTLPSNQYTTKELKIRKLWLIGSLIFNLSIPLLIICFLFIISNPDDLMLHIGLTLLAICLIIILPSLNVWSLWHHGYKQAGTKYLMFNLIGIGFKTIQLFIETLKTFPSLLVLLANVVLLIPFVAMTLLHGRMYVINRRVKKSLALQAKS